MGLKYVQIGLEPKRVARTKELSRLNRDKGCPFPPGRHRWMLLVRTWS